MGLEKDRFGNLSKVGKPSVGSVPFQTPGLCFPRSFRNSFLNRTAVAQMLTSPPLERLRTRGLGEEAWWVPRPPARRRLRCVHSARWLCSRQLPVAQRRPFRGTPPPTAEGYLQPGAGCRAGTRGPGAGSGGKFSRGERREGLVTSRTHPSGGSHTACPRAANFVFFRRTVPTQTFRI